MKKSIKSKAFSFTFLLISSYFMSCQSDFEESPSKEQTVQEKKEASSRDLLVEQASKGGLEIGEKTSSVSSTPKITARSVATDFLNTRVLINGSIIGYNVSGYQQSYISPKGNFMTPIAELLRRFEYTVTYKDYVLTATRNSTNSFGVERMEFSVLERQQPFVKTIKGDDFDTVFLPESPILSDGSVFAPARIIALLAGAKTVEYDNDTKTLQTYYYEVNDFGIYFYGIQQNSATDAVGCQKYIPGEPNPFFNPNSKTLIYAHGFQPGSVVAGGREGFLFNQAESGNQNVQNYWKINGQNWNVGIYHWIQLADDGNLPPNNVEYKIYDVNSRGIGMRWKKSDGNFSTRGNATLNATQLYRQEYQKVVSAIGARELRLIGNSLGGNLTMAMLREVAINGSRLPNRVTLMDPYWGVGITKNAINLPTNFLTPDPQPNSTDTRYVGKDAAQRLSAKDVAIEYFRSSVAGIDGYNRGVANIAQLSIQFPNYTENPVAKHTQPTRVYMWLMGLPYVSGASPTTSDLFVKSYMNTDKYFKQYDNFGSKTATPSDDDYFEAFGKP